MDKMDFRELLLSLAVKNDCTAYFEGEKANIFCRLTEHMLAVNESFNLTAIKEPSRIALLHYIDSLKGADVFSEGAKIIDIGAGAGFPSLPLAIARPDLEIIAVDSTAKRMRYVEETAKMLGLSNIKTVTARAEDLGKNKDFREKFENGLGYCMPHLNMLIKGSEKHLGSSRQSEFLRTLFELQRKNMQRIQEEVNWFTKKFDYRNNDAPWGNSKDSVLRSIRKISGAKDLE